MSLPPLSLYVHLPWCERKCPYCDFNSHERAGIPEQRYIDALLADLRADLPLVQGRSVETVFIGGGTPSLFSVAGISALLAGIAGLLPLSGAAEITLEANPGSAEAEKFRGFREAGVNRLSLGIQSFDDACLEALGRVHDSEQACTAIEHALAAGFDSFNIDLMHGLPGQDAGGACADLRQALRYRPPHLSWYQLTIEPNTAFHKRPPALPGEESLADIQEAGESLLEAAGYRQYEVSAYSLPGRECRHNLNYWTFGDYLGIGAGAHGKITLEGGGIRRQAKRRRPESYMGASGAGFTAAARLLGPEEIPGEFMLNALRLNQGFSLTQFTARTGLSAETVVPAIEDLCARSLLRLEDGQVATTARGRRFLDDVVATFFPD
ncbi:MAG: radical SAM family heme chaperone HemW [Halioglobus sp.]